MYRAAIVDDSEVDRELLHTLVMDYCEHHPLRISVQCFESGAAFLTAHQEQPFQLVFMDVYLVNESGMDTARQLRDEDGECLIVFVSSSDAFAVESYRVRAFDYLLKPYTAEDFARVMSLCDTALRRRVPQIAVKEGRLMRSLPVGSILFTDYSNHYIQIHTNEGLVRTYMPFRTFCELLGAYPQMLCCYRNVMVNIDHIASLEEQDFVLDNGARVPIGRQMRQEVLQQVADYLGKQGRVHASGLERLHD